MSILDDEDILVSQTREAASIDSRIIENAKKYFSDEITGRFVTLFISDEELKTILFCLNQSLIDLFIVLTAKHYARMMRLDFLRSCLNNQTWCDQLY